MIRGATEPGEDRVKYYWEKCKRLQNPHNWIQISFRLFIHVRIDYAICLIILIKSFRVLFRDSSVNCMCETNTPVQSALTTSISVS